MIERVAITHRLVHFALFAALSAVQIGCTPHVRVAVSAIADPEFDPTVQHGFVIHPANPQVPPTDLLFSEIASQVAIALTQRGYERRESEADADLAILLDFGTSDPIVSRSEYGYPYFYGDYGYYGGHHGRYFGYGPAYFHGYSYSVRDTTYYQTLLRMDAVALPMPTDDSLAPQLWTVKATTVTRSDDLRLLVPYLIVASKPMWGTDTGKQISIKLDRDDERVERLRDAEPLR